MVLTDCRNTSVTTDELDFNKSSVTTDDSNIITKPDDYSLQLNYETLAEKKAHFTILSKDITQNSILFNKNCRILPLIRQKLQKRAS